MKKIRLVELLFLFGLSFPISGISGFLTVEFPESKGSLVENVGSMQLRSSGSGELLAIAPFSGNGQISARVRLQSQDTNARIGIGFRQNTNAESAYAGIFLSEQKLIFERRLRTGEETIATQATETAIWLRVIREGAAFSGSFSHDGTNWKQFSADSIDMPNSIFAGFVIRGKGDAQVEDIQVSSAILKQPQPNAHFVAPANIAVAANVESPKSPKLVEFLSGYRKIGEANQPPFTMNWTNALAGDHTVSAKVTDAYGAEFFTEPVLCTVELPKPSVKFIGVDKVTRGNWRGKYGTDGFHIIGHSTNYPAYADVMTRGNNMAFLHYTTNAGAPLLTNGTHRVAAHWYTYTNMLVQITLLDGKSHRIAWYFQDWGSDARVQDVEVINPETGTIMDSRRLAKFPHGEYLIWEIRGSVTFRISRVAGGPTAVCGIFFDETPIGENP